MSNEKSNPLKEIRPGFINLTDIYGVAEVGGKLTYAGGHPDFPNPKSHLRPEVIKELAEASDPSNIPPIEVYQHKGAVVVIDGTHRLINAIERYNEQPEVWGKIKVTRVTGNISDAQVRAFAANLYQRDNLTSAELFAGVSRFLTIGWTIDEIKDKFGKLSSRILRQIEDVLNADSSVSEAVASGALDIGVGAAIARKVDATEQAEAVEKGKRLKAEGEDNIRAKIGARKVREGLGSIKDVDELVLGDDNYATSILDDPDTETNMLLTELLMTVYGKNALTTDQFRDWLADRQQTYLDQVEDARQKEIERNRKIEERQRAKAQARAKRVAKAEKVEALV